MSITILAYIEHHGPEALLKAPALLAWLQEHAAPAYTDELGIPHWHERDLAVGWLKVCPPAPQKREPAWRPPHVSRPSVQAPEMRREERYRPPPLARPKAEKAEID